MGKKVFLVGSSQTKHIAKLLKMSGIQCLEMNREEIRKLNWAARKMVGASMLLQSDIVYCVGGSYRKTRITRLASLFKKKVVMHWIGTDVLFAQDKKKRGIKFQENDVEVAGSQLLVKELGSMGIEACWIPIVPFDCQFELKKMPKEHSVLAYLPEGREEFYGSQIIWELAKREPGIRFHIVANRGISGMESENIKFHGFLNSAEMEKLYEEVTILFRYPEHDGLSMMVIEALGMGKNVLYKYEHPYVVTPKSGDFHDIYDSLKSLLDKPVSLNREGHSFVKEFYSPKRIMELYNKNHIFD